MNGFSAAKKLSEAAKYDSDFNYDSNHAFYQFYRNFEKFKRIVSIDSKHGELKEFYKLLSDFNNHRPTSNKTKSYKDRILNNVNQLYNKYFDTYKKNDCDSENLNEREENFFDPNQFKILNKQTLEWTKEKTEGEMQNPIRFKIIKKEFEEKTKREMQRPIWFEIDKK